ncbi:MAG TPA: hypothetical protein VF082_01260 [Jiangellaceae bacterium]
MANGSGAAVVGLLIGIILAAEAAGWGDDDGDGLALDSDSGAADDTTSSAPAVPTSVDGGTTARPHPGDDDAAVITVTDRFGRTVALAVPPAAGPDVAAGVIQTLADHQVRAAICPNVADSRRHPLCDPTTTAVAIGLDDWQGVHSSAGLDTTLDALSDEGFAVVGPPP